jgi:hypothetical protein
MFCRRKAEEGAFGDFVYAEGEYFHDADSGCNLREVRRSRLDSESGQEWLALEKTYSDRGLRDAPMFYPTHSVSGPVAVMQAHAVEATCYGRRCGFPDPYYDLMEFSNQVALFKMSNDACLRICECREVGGSFHDSETFRIVGTRGTFAENRWKHHGRVDALTGHPAKVEELTAEDMRDPLPPEVLAAFEACSDIRNVYGGHGGSHAYLAHEFVDAVAHARTPAIHAWEAVRYMAMGAVAHKSALRNGETLKVPDWGNAPA